jgi:DNA-binding CsgD family transcriptional regulator
MSRRASLSHTRKIDLTAAYIAGQPVKVIAYEFGVDQPAVTKIATRFGATHRYRNASRSQLGNDAEDGVLAMFRGGKDTMSIALCLRVKEPTVVKALIRAKERERVQ